MVVMEFSGRFAEAINGPNGTAVPSFGPPALGRFASADFPVACGPVQLQVERIMKPESHA
jgi:hypothetical protein